MSARVWRAGAAMAVAAVAWGGGAAAIPVCAEVPAANDRCPSWTATYDEPAGHSLRGRDQANAMAISPDGSLVYVAGQSMGESTDYDYAVVARQAGTGAAVWTARYDGPESINDAAHALAVSPAQVFVTGQSQGGEGGLDYGTLALDAATGARRWLAVYDSGEADVGRAIALSPDGLRVYVAGTSVAGDAMEVTTVAYDSATGARLWTATHEGPTDYYFGYLVDLEVAPDGSSVYVTSEQGGDFLTVAYEAADPERTGERLWAARYDGGWGLDVPAALGVSADGQRVFVTGTSDDEGMNELGSTNAAYATVAYDAATGVRAWASRYGVSPTTQAFSLAVSPTGELFVTGEQRGPQTGRSGFGTVAYDAATGAERWSAYHEPPGFIWNEARSVGVSPDGSRVYVAGFSGSPLATGGSFGSFHPAGFGLVAYDAASGSTLWAARHEPAPGQAGPYYRTREILGVSRDAIFVTGTLEYTADPTDPELEHGNYSDWQTVAYRP